MFRLSAQPPVTQQADFLTHVESMYVCMLVLLALQDLHAVQAAHTDVRWANIIQLVRDAFLMIDLETAVPLGSTWNIAMHWK